MQDILNAMRRPAGVKPEASRNTEVVINIGRDVEKRACMDVTRHYI